MAFIEAGLRQLPIGAILALLLPCDFDSGKTRARYFRDCPHFVGKIVLTQRVVWFHPDEESVSAERKLRVVLVAADVAAPSSPAGDLVRARAR